MGKYLRKNKPKRNIPLCAAAVLYCLTVLTTYLVCGLYARYSTSGQTGDQARVAKFSVVGSCTLSQSIDHGFVPGDSIEVPIVIHNNSEVAVEYTMEVTTEGNLPLTFSMTKSGASPDIEDESRTKFTAQQLPGDHRDNYSLTIQWPEPANANDKARDLKQMGMVDYITVTVTATQTD